MAGKFFGQPVRRNEDPRLIRGLGAYVDDLAGGATVVLVRSPYAHATFRVAERPDAGANGVIAVLTGEDLAPVPIVPTVIGHPDLLPCGEPAVAVDRVRYAGQIVAAVVAGTPYEAVDAAELVRVEYEPLPVVTDARSALSATAPLLHEQLEANEAGRIRHRVGDPEAAFADAEIVVQGTFDSHRYNGQPLEPRGAIAEYDAGLGMLTLWTSTQWPHTVRDGLREVFGLPEHRIRVVAPDVGGGFGIKQEVYPEEVLLCLIAKRTGIRVRWTETRTEHFLAANHSREQSHEIELAATKDGIVTAMRARVWTDMGAYVRGLGLLAPSCTAAELPGPYRIQHYDVDVRCALTNKTPIGVYRGAGLPEAVYATERAMDRLADRLGIDPAEIRRRNFIARAEFPWDTGNRITQLRFVYDSGDYHAGLEHALDALGYDEWRRRQEEARAEGRLLGIGLASFVLLSGLGPYESADLRVDPSGRIAVVTGSSPHGQGLATTIAQVVADVLDVAPDSIDVAHGDTSRIPFGQGTYASRSGVTATNAALLAARRVRDKALALAAHLLEIDSRDLEFRNGAVVVIGSPDRRVALGDLALAAAPGAALPSDMEPGLESRGYFDAPDCTFASGTHAAVVEVDPEIGTVQVLDYVAVTDPGRVINPIIADGQIVGGFAQGFGGTMSEELAYDENGQLLAASFADYLVPRSVDDPPLRVLFDETPSTLNPLGVKGLGEAGTVGAPAALTNAVEDALRPLRVQLQRTPLTAARIFDLLHAPRSQSDAAAERSDAHVIG